MLFSYRTTFASVSSGLVIDNKKNLAEIFWKKILTEVEICKVKTRVYAVFVSQKIINSL